MGVNCFVRTYNWILEGVVSGSWTLLVQVVCWFGLEHLYEVSVWVLFTFCWVAIGVGGLVWTSMLSSFRVWLLLGGLYCLGCWC